MRFFCLLLLFPFIFASCKKNTNVSKIPAISFRSMDPASVKAGSDTTVLIKFNFEDGDGDIGFGTPNLFFRDSRDTIWAPFLIPNIPDRFNPEAGLKGIIQVEYEAAFLLLRNDSLHKDYDTLHWDIYMKDKAGNESNIITTPDLYLYK